MKKHKIIKIAIVVAMFVLGGAFYSSLPTEIPSHWGYGNQPDSWMSKQVGTWLLPLLALGALLLFSVLAKADPKRSNYKHFEKTWHYFQISILSFLAYIYIITLLAANNQNLLVGNYVVGGVGVLFAIIGGLLPKVKQNYFVGIRTPWALADEKNWNKTHVLGGKTFIIGGLLMVAGVLVASPALYSHFFIATIISLVFIPFVYSYLISRKK